ncbi:MAG: SMC-Scp complex subunit ScpB [Slackia sp.]|nr:SMC-Scp complex subunit ScpB [Slackia sp.]
MSDSFSQKAASTLSGAIEALLFVSDEPVDTATLSRMLDVDKKSVVAALETLQEHLSSDVSGIRLREVAGGWRLYTDPCYHEPIERYVLSWDTRRLSQAALETLAVIAYMQPVTRAGIASVRGVNSDSPLNSLVEKGLVREAGRDASSPGQPVLYVTTKAFLERFGLARIDDLPDIGRFACDEQTRTLIEERLGLTKSQVDDASTTADADDDAAGFVSDFVEAYESGIFEEGEGHDR